MEAEKFTTLSTLELN